MFDNVLDFDKTYQTYKNLLLKNPQDVQYHIDKDNAYAFGDGYNDQAMFREVGHGIAMGNAVDVLKEKATYITDNFDQEGILKALYHEKVLNEKDNY